MNSEAMIMKVATGAISCIAASMDIDATLSEAQQADAESITNAKRRRERRAVYAAFNILTGKQPLLAHTAAGAPILIVDGRPLPGFCSVSHCATVVAVSYSPSTVHGIDIEDESPKIARVASRFLSEEERARFISNHELLRAWTIKEAAYKAAGIEGLPLIEGIVMGESKADAIEVAIRVGGKKMSATSVDVTPTTILSIVS